MSLGYPKRCPRCGATGGDLEWLSTTNEWDGYCRRCDVRFNDRGELHPDSKPPCTIPTDHYS